MPLSEPFLPVRPPIELRWGKTDTHKLRVTKNADNTGAVSPSRLSNCSACLTDEAAVNLGFNLVSLCRSPARKTIKSGRKSKLLFAGAVGIDCEKLELSDSPDRPVEYQLFPVG